MYNSDRCKFDDRLHDDYLFYISCVLLSHLYFPFRQMYPSKAVIMILAVTTIQAEKDGVYFKIEENTFRSDEDAIWSGKAASLLSCSLMCARQETCKSANFITGSEACLSYKKTRARNIDVLLPQEGSFYIEKVSFF